MTAGGGCVRSVLILGPIAAFPLCGAAHFAHTGCAGCANANTLGGVAQAVRKIKFGLRGVRFRRYARHTGASRPPVSGLLGDCMKSIHALYENFEDASSCQRKHGGIAVANGGARTFGGASKNITNTRH